MNSRAPGYVEKSSIGEKPGGVGRTWSRCLRLSLTETKSKAAAEPDAVLGHFSRQIVNTYIALDKAFISITRVTFSAWEFYIN